MIIFKVYDFRLPKGKNTLLLFADKELLKQ